MSAIVGWESFCSFVLMSESGSGFVGSTVDYGRTAPCVPTG